MKATRDMNALSKKGAQAGIVVNALSPVAKTRIWGVTGEPENLKPEGGGPGECFWHRSNARVAVMCCAPATARVCRKPWR